MEEVAPCTAHDVRHGKQRRRAALQFIVRRRVTGAPPGARGSGGRPRRQRKPLVSQSRGRDLTPTSIHMSTSANTSLVQRVRRRHEAYPFHCSADRARVDRYLKAELRRPLSDAFRAIHLAPIRRRRFSDLGPPADCPSFSGAVRVVNDHIVWSKAPNCFLRAH
jgi:hypothetical protein